MGAEQPNFSFGSLLSSFAVFFVSFLVCSGYLVPDLVNKSLIEGNTLKSGRYAITFPAIEWIDEQESDAIVAIGNSVLQYATDGQCIREQLNGKNPVYNLAISGANPYTEMVQIPALVEAQPKMVLLDLGPNSLWSFYNSSSLDEYIQFRFTILSLTSGLQDSGDWNHLLRSQDRPFIASTLEERIRLTSSYSQTAIDNLLWKEVDEYVDVSYYDRKMPEVNGEGWDAYLQTPTFMPPKFETWNQSEVVDWFEENMASKARMGGYNPQQNGTLNHRALEYAIASLTEANIEVVMVAVPHHPLAYDYLSPGQIDGHNATLNYFEQTYGAKSVNWFWEEWDQQMFRDRNHLGDQGRMYFCERMADELNQMEWS